MALILTVVAIAIGLGLGVRWGGEPQNVLSWRPPLWEALAAGLAVVTLLDLVGASGGFVALLSILATAAILAFTVVNIRIGGMVLISTGVGINLFVTLINWGTPVSASALVRSGLADETSVSDLVLTGGRSVSSGALLGFLGDVIPLPWGQVISVGDILVLVGTTLVTASVLRGTIVGRSRRPSGTLGTVGYSDSLSALGRGPAPRRGPGLHPSRLTQPGERRPKPRHGSPPRRRTPNKSSQAVRRQPQGRRPR